MKDCVGAVRLGVQVRYDANRATASNAPSIWHVWGLVTRTKEVFLLPLFRYKVLARVLFGAFGLRTVAHGSDLKKRGLSGIAIQKNAKPQLFGKEKGDFLTHQNCDCTHFQKVDFL